MKPSSTRTHLLQRALVIPLLVGVVACAGNPNATEVRAPQPSQSPAPRPTSEPTPQPTDEQTPQPTSEPTSTPASQQQADITHGKELYASLGCADCHGPEGEGGIGPTIARTQLPLARVIRQYRTPYQNMVRFGPDQVSDSGISDIYAFLHTLPTPASRVPSVLARVTPESSIGTVRGTIRYEDSGEPAADERIYILPASQGPGGSLTYHYQPHLPAATTDAQGRFEIAEVEARLYAVFFTRQEAPIRDQDGNIVLVNVAPGEVAEAEGLIPAP